MLQAEDGINYLPQANKLQPPTTLLVVPVIEKLRVVKTNVPKKREERPHTSSPRFSSNSEDYLDAKKSFSNRRMTLFLEPVKV